MWIPLILVLCFSTALSQRESCGELPTVLNARPRESHIRPPFAKGTGVPYECVSGYFPTGGSDEAVCLEVSGVTNWTPPTLLCERNGCEAPPEVPLARPEETGDIPPFKIGTRIRYNCHPGYVKHQGTDEAVCRLKDGVSQWATPTVRCAGINCGDPGDVNNGEKNGRLFIFPNFVNYTCYDGYRLSSERNLYCLPSGQWTAQKPECLVVSCPDLNAPMNGLVSAQETSYRSIAKYSCNTGFKLKGKKERQCLSTGSWSDSAPECDVVSCDPISDYRGGKVVTGVNKTQVGDLVILKCFELGFTTTLKCNDLGDWAPAVPVCQEPTTTTQKPLSTQKPKNNTTDSKFPFESVPCSHPGPISHGHFDSTVKFPTFGSVDYICDEGYQLKGKSTLVCMGAGEWDVKMLPRCEKKMWVELIVGLVVGSVVLIVICLGCVLLYLKKRKNAAPPPIPPGVKNKAHALDAKHQDEIRYLERDRKFVPVTSL